MPTENPEHLLAHAHLLHRSGQFPQAAAVYESLLSETSDPAVLARLHGLLAELAVRMNRADEAIDHYRKVLRLAPDSPEAGNNLGLLLLNVGAAAEAKDVLERIVALHPAYSKALNNLGTALAQAKDFEGAKAQYEAAIRAEPNYDSPRYNLAKHLIDHGFFDAGEAQARELLRLHPNHANAHHALAHALAGQRRHAESIAEFRQSIALNPNPAHHSNLLLHLHYAADLSPRQIGNEHFRWGQRWANAPRRTHVIRDWGTRRLNVALLSPDLHMHPVAQFILPLLSHFDRNELEITVFSDSRQPDAFTERLKGLANAWFDSSRSSDEQLADKLRVYRIDIAIDLAGHTAGNRLLALAAKPAPVQISYLGYPNTTGVAGIDFRITDALADPPGENDDLFSEQLLRMPACAWCWEPPLDLPDVGPLPALTNGHITFGSFNNIRKISAATLDLWCNVLTAIPTAKLILKASGVTQPESQNRFLTDFESRGIDPIRVAYLEQPHDPQAHLDQYNKMDIALDTYPYHGTTTTCEALTMGVPVLTLAGPSHVSRVGVSLLTNAGLAELIADSPKRLAEIAVSLSVDLNNVSDLRNSLRRRLVRSPLCDGKVFASHFAQILRKLVRE